MDNDTQNQQKDESAASGSQSTSTQPVTPAVSDFEQKRKLVGVLSYLSILVVVAYIIADKDARLMFHVKQGVVLFICEIAAMVIVQTILFILAPLLLILNILFLAFSIIGIMNVLKGRDKELPLIGHLATHVPL